MTVVLVLVIVTQLGKNSDIFDRRLSFFLFVAFRNAGARFACGLIKLTSHGYVHEPTFILLALAVIYVFLLDLFD